MASSEQTLPISGEAPPTPEHTPPPSWLAPPTPQQTPPTPEQMSPTFEQVPTPSEQAPPTYDTSRDVDLTYQLLVQQIDGARPTQCSNPNDHISVRTDTTSNLNPQLFETDQVLCRAYCNWSGYRGDGSVIYSRRQDTLVTSDPDEMYLQTGHGIYGTVVKTILMAYLSGTRYPGGKVVMDEGRYVRMTVNFAAAAGSPARSVKVWGKRVVSNETRGAVKLSEEEILEFAKEGNAWTRQPDN